MGKGEKVVIALHGRGGSAADILQLAATLSNNTFTLLAPQATGFSWYPYSFLAPPEQNEPSLSSALSMVKQTLDKVVANGISLNNIYLLGFSQGGILAYDLALRYPELADGIACFSARLEAGWLTPEQIAGAAGLRAFIAHGRQDRAVPYASALEAERILSAAGCKVTLQEYEGGHGLSVEALQAAEQWMLAPPAAEGRE